MARKRKRKRTNPRRKPATQADLAKVKKETERAVMIASLAIPLMAAHDVYGFGAKRLEKLLDRMLELYRDYEAGSFTMDEAKGWLEGYTGIEIEG